VFDCKSVPETKQTRGKKQDKIKILIPHQTTSQLFVISTWNMKKTEIFVSH